MRWRSGTWMVDRKDVGNMRRHRRSLKAILAQDYQLYLMLLVPVALVVIFCYWPMYGAQIAFKNYNIVGGVWGSPWAGVKWFERFVTGNMFWSTLENTLWLSLYSLFTGFPLSIVLALSLNCVRSRFYKKAIQMISYAPHFISVVVMTGILFQLFNARFGVIGRLLSFIANREVDIFLNPASFRHVYVWSGVWQGLGFGSIIYISVLSSVSPELHEAAIIDGATRLQRVRHIDFPAVLPTAIVMVILNTGGILNTGFEKVLLLQNSLNLATSEVIDTYSYKMGLASSMPNYSYGTAIGLFKSVVCFILLMIVNKIAQKCGDTSLW